MRKVYLCCTKKCHNTEKKKNHFFILCFVLGQPLYCNSDVHIDIKNYNTSILDAIIKLYPYPNYNLPCDQLEKKLY